MEAYRQRFFYINIKKRVVRDYYFPDNPYVIAQKGFYDTKK